MFKIILSLFILGFSFGSGPCLASCGPILISYLAGAKKNIASSLLVYALFSLARISAYIVLAFLVFFLGRFAAARLAGFSPYLFILGGSFLIFLGILIAAGNNLEIRLCSILQKKFLEQDKKSAIMLGVIIGLLPCGPLIALLSYIGLISKTWADTFFYCLSFGLGTFISPLVVLAALAGFIPRILGGRKEILGKIFKAVCGAVMVLLGVQLIFKAF